jgi:dTDP-4-amino-4,6-dideoxygalactose transaminase
MEKLAVDGGKPVRTNSFPVWPIYGAEEERLLLEVLHSRVWGGTGGPNKLPQLEEMFTQMHGAKHAITVVNGTLGLTVALKAAGVKPGDEVIMPAYTFIATATSALLFGAIPVFVDVKKESMLIDPHKIEEAVTPRTRAIVAVHLAGAPADLPLLKQIAKKYNLALIEDSAQGVGAALDGVPVGAVGDMGSFSFQSGKNVTAGEGGILLTNDEKIADHAWSLANVGRVRNGAWYQHENLGWNLRMTEFQAAVILGQLSRYEEQFQLRDTNAKRLHERLNEVEGVQVLKEDPRITRHARHMYMLRLEPDLIARIGKQEWLRRVKAEGIPVLPGYVSLNQNQAVINETRSILGEEKRYECPVSEQASDQEIVWLGQNVLLGDEQDMEDIVKAIQKVNQTIG